MHFVLNHIPHHLWERSRKKGGPRAADRDGMDKEKITLSWSLAASAQIATSAQGGTIYKIHLSPLSSETHDLNVKKHTERRDGHRCRPFWLLSARRCPGAAGRSNHINHLALKQKGAFQWAESAYGNTWRPLNLFLVNVPSFHTAEAFDFDFSFVELSDIWRK